MASRTKAARGVRRIRQLIQLHPVPLPHMQAHGHEGIILVSLGPRASPRYTRTVLISGPPLSLLARPSHPII
jgi:hypothetical protein